MLAPEHRLRRSRDFADVLKGGTRAGRKTLIVHVRRDAGTDRNSVDPVRAGLVVSKAVGNAVVRHRVSRRLRHLLIPYVDGPSALPLGSLLVVRASPAAAGAGSEVLAADLSSAVRSATRPSATRVGSRS